MVMAEVLVRFTEPVRAADGQLYSAQACGGVASDGLWEAWIEFVDASGMPVRTPRETEQPNRDALVYWAEGLSAAYLQGALRRALDVRVAPPVIATGTEASLFSGPARSSAAAQPVRPHSVLDPFTTYVQGEGVLRQQLWALSRDHLLTLIDAYHLDVGNGFGPRIQLSTEELIDGIIHAVKAHSSSV
jgi:hypothetical protein